MNELSFLIDLLLNHKLPKATQIIVKARLDDIQNRVAIIDNSDREPPKPQSFRITPQVSPVPIENVAQTPAAQAALAQRQAMIDAAKSKTDARHDNSEISWNLVNELAEYRDELEDIFGRKSCANAISQISSPSPANFPFQADFIESPGNKKALFCTRRSPRALRAAFFWAHTALNYPGVNCLYLGLTRDSSKGSSGKIF